MKKLSCVSFSVCRFPITALAGVCALTLGSSVAFAQGQAQARAPQAAAGAAAVVSPSAAGIVPPPGYVIGADDVLSVLFWREKDLTTDVSVRPDGKITLPLLNDVQAAGLTPEQLKENVTKAAAQYVQDPNVTVVVKAINSRKVFITGSVAKPGPYALVSPTTVLQLIAIAGGVQEFADAKNITVLRNEDGKSTTFRFNYSEVAKRKNLKQNIELKPGDTVLVP